VKHITRKSFQLLFSLALIACLTVWLAPVAAAHTARPGNGPNGAGYFYVTNVNRTSTETDSDYAITADPGASVSLTRSWTVSNSWTATVGIDAKVVSAQVNFDVTASTETSETCSNGGANTANTAQLIQWQDVFDDYDFDIYWHNNLTNQDMKQGTGFAKKFDHPNCGVYQMDSII
jgi:hypothetical protein